MIIYMLRRHCAIEYGFLPDKCLSPRFFLANIQYLMIAQRLKWWDDKSILSNFENPELF